MRRWAASEVRWNGIQYPLIHDDDPIAADLSDNGARYGLGLIESKAGATLYSID